MTFIDVQKYPKTSAHGEARSFSNFYLNKYNKWLVYSERRDGVFCCPCAIFATDRTRKGSLVNEAFTNWKMISHKLKEHNNLPYHIRSLEMAANCVQSYNNPSKSMHNILDKQRSSQVLKNRDYIIAIIKCIIYLAKQGLAFRGDQEDLDKPGNHGNFLALMELIADFDEVTREYINNNNLQLKYLSPKIQNELIHIIAHDFVLEPLLQEIR